MKKKLNIAVLTISDTRNTTEIPLDISREIKPSCEF